LLSRQYFHTHTRIANFSENSTTKIFLVKKNESLKRDPHRRNI